MLASTGFSVAQSHPSFSYYYDDSGQLIKVIDSSGNEIGYTYDAVGNITQITRGLAPAANVLAITNFTPQSGGAGITVTIQGQNFSATAASNAVKFNGAAATVVSATATSLTVTVPPTATTGPITVTVNGTTATSASNFTFIPVPNVLTIKPNSSVSIAEAINIPALQVTGSNLTGSTFTFSPAFTPPAVAINSVTIDPSGTSATLNVTVAAGASGAYTLLATNASGASSTVATTANTLHILSPNNDDDGDGLINAVEIAIGTDPLNPDTSGAGLPDGWQVFYGLNPLNASVSSEDLDGSGLTVLQDFQQSLSPLNPNLVPPSVLQTNPANGATGVFINSVFVARFAEPLLTGTTLLAAQNAITAALGANSTVPASSEQIAATTLQAYMNRTCCGNSVIPGTVSLTGPNGAITGGIAASNDSLSVTFSPAQPLSANTTYSYVINGVRDAAGNLMTVPATGSFTTGSTVDSAAPTITLVDPENNLGGVPVNAHYVVQFSKAMDPSTLTLANFYMVNRGTNTAVPGMVQVNADGITASFIPSQPLPVATYFYTAVTTGVKDTSGNSLASTAVFYFSTGDQAETAGPTLVTNSPMSGSTGVPLNAIIDLQFSEPLDIATVGPNIQVTTGGQPVAVSIALSDGDQRVTLTPTAALQANAAYIVTIGAGISDLAGMTLSNSGSFSFQTGALADFSQLSVLTVSPWNGLTGVGLNTLVELRLSKAVDVSSVGAGDVLLYPSSVGGAGFMTGKVSVSADGLSVSMTPMTPLVAETQYCVYVDGMVDEEGNGLQQNNQTVSCFTTGTAAVTTGPTVIAVSPASGATGVPVNALVELELSEPVSAASVQPGAIAVSAGGVAVPGAVTVSGTSVVVFTPSSPLAVNTAYTVKAAGFTDLSGNAVTAFAGDFTTGSSSSADTGPLQVVSITPSNGSTGVGVTTPVVVTFNAAVNPLTVNDVPVNVQLSTGETVAGSYAVSGAVVTFTPLTALPGGATVTVRVDYYGSVEDLAGNNGQYGASTFTTAPVADTVSPTVLSVTPVGGATGIGSNGQVVLTFSKSMNPATLTACCTTGNYSNVYLLGGETRLGFQPSVSVDNRTLTLSALNLPASTVITVVATHGATDLSGNALADFSSQFTTGPGIETGHGSVVNQRPGTGSTGVGVKASPIVLFMNVALNGSTVQGAVHVAQNGQLVAGTVTLGGNGQTIEFTPAAPWAYGALVQVFLDATAEDVSGNTVTAYQSSFMTAGNPVTTGPSLVGYTPGYNATGVPLNALIEAQYNEPLSAATVSGSTVYLDGPAGRVTGTVSLDTTGTVVQLTPGSALTAGGYYCFYLQSLQGTNGLAAQNFGYCFTAGSTAAATAPAVVAVSPADKLSGVPLNARVSVLFGAQIDALTVSGTTIQLSGGGQTEVPASISFANNNQTVEIVPEAALPASTVMTLTISGITDGAGNAVAAQTTHFTTGVAPATATPYVIVENPAYQATGVPLNALISIESNAAIDATTVNSDTFDPVGPLNQEVAGTYSLSADALTAFFVPSAALAVGQQYSVNFQSRGMTDLVGNLLSCCGYGTLGNFYFTTGFSASTAGPQVTGVNPPNAQTQAPTNAQIVVQFNEPVDGESLGGVTLAAGATAVPFAASLSNGNQTLTLTPSVELAQNTPYTLTVAGVTDLSANPMAAPFTSSFTTGADPDFSQLSVLTVFDPKGPTVTGWYYMNPYDSSLR